MKFKQKTKFKKMESFKYKQQRRSYLVNENKENDKKVQ